MTQFTGLSEREAALSREKYGSNAIPESEPTTFWAEFKATFQDPMIRILLAVALLMVVMCLFGYADVYEPAGTILAVILVAIVSAKTGVSSDTKYRQLKGSAKKRPVQGVPGRHHYHSGRGPGGGGGQGAAPGRG